MTPKLKFDPFRRWLKSQRNGIKVTCVFVSTSWLRLYYEWNEKNRRLFFKVLTLESVISVQDLELIT